MCTRKQIPADVRQNGFTRIKRVSESVYIFSSPTRTSVIFIWWQIFYFSPLITRFVKSSALVSHVRQKRIVASPNRCYGPSDYRGININQTSYRLHVISDLKSFWIQFSDKVKCTEKYLWKTKSLRSEPKTVLVYQKYVDSVMSWEYCSRPAGGFKYYVTRFDTKKTLRTTF